MHMIQIRDYGMCDLCSDLMWRVQLCMYSPTCVWYSPEGEAAAMYVQPRVGSVLSSSEPQQCMYSPTCVWYSLVRDCSYARTRPSVSATPCGAGSWLGVMKIACHDLLPRSAGTAVLLLGIARGPTSVPVHVSLVRCRTN